MANRMILFGGINGTNLRFDGTPLRAMRPLTIWWTRSTVASTNKRVVIATLIRGGIHETNESER